MTHTVVPHPMGGSSSLPQPLPCPLPPSAIPAVCRSTLPLSVFIPVPSCSGPQRVPPPSWPPSLWCPAPPGPPALLPTALPNPAAWRPPCSVDQCRSVSPASLPTVAPHTSLTQVPPGPFPGHTMPMSSCCSLAGKAAPPLKLRSNVRASVRLLSGP